MAAASDPYKVLGISPEASEAQLRAAYHRLVQLHHPDHNHGSAESARRFEEVHEAYARVRQLRASRPAEGQPPRTPDSDPDVEARLAKLERELRKAHAKRERARRAAAEAATDRPERPSDDELGYVTTDDSFSKILADAQSELSDWLDRAGDQPKRRRVADLIDDLAAKVRGDRDRGSGE